MDRELVIPLLAGKTLRCSQPPGGRMGEVVRICDEDGRELVRWNRDEWARYPEAVMAAIFSASAPMRIADANVLLREFSGSI